MAWAAPEAEPEAEAAAEAEAALYYNRHYHNNHYGHHGYHGYPGYYGGYYAPYSRALSYYGYPLTSPYHGRLYKRSADSDANAIGKKHALKKYEQFILNTSCFCTMYDFHNFGLIFVGQCTVCLKG